MPRQPQPPFAAGHFYHLFNRANSRSDLLFFEPRNYRHFLDRWGRLLGGQLEVWAYCLIPNHYHFLVRVAADPPDPINESLRRLTIGYSQAINRARGRRGSLFQEHPKRLVVESERHLLALIRYIHLNPIHHGLVESPHRWHFSSFNTIRGTGPTRLARDQILGLFGSMEAFEQFHALSHDTREIAYCLADTEEG